MSKLEKLLQSLRRSDSGEKIQTGDSPRLGRIQIVKEQLKRKIIRQYKQPWKGNNVIGKKDEFIGLRGKVLNNWEIDRIMLSNRSYARSRDLKQVKISQEKSLFSKVTSKDENGHYFYLYESQIPRINKIKSQNQSVAFIPSGSIGKKYFGLKDLKNSFSMENYASM